LASRAHLQTIIPTIEETFTQSGISKQQLQGIAVTYGPGLVGALLVGVNTAKALAFALDLPLIGINHLEGHIFANQLDHAELQPPLITLLISGGHSILILVQDWGRYQILGRTIDDAAGEAFDKVAKMLTLGYPGGPIIDQMAKNGDTAFYRFPRAWLQEDSLNFSFSGLKTAVLTFIESHPEAYIRQHVADICASFQQAVADVLIEKTIMAAIQYGIKQIALAGGVARNQFLRKQFITRASHENMSLYFPSPDFCTDNAAMIGKAGVFRLQKGERASFSLDAEPNLKLLTVTEP